MLNQLKQNDMETIAQRYQGTENTIQINSSSVFADFIKVRDIRPSSIDIYKRNLQRFWDFLEANGKDINNITLYDICDYRDYIRSLGVSSLTEASYLSIVKNYYSYLASVMLYPDIAKGVKTTKRENRIEKEDLTINKSQELLQYAHDRLSLRDYAIVNLMLYTGLRCIEISRLKISDITSKLNTKGELVRVLNVWGKGRSEADKGKTENFVKLVADAYRPIEKYLRTERKGAKTNEPLFTSASNNNQKGHLSTRAISGIVKNCLKEIGLNSSSFTAHSIRHTTACLILENGGAREEVKKVLRHKSINTSVVYTKSLEDRERLDNAPEDRLQGLFKIF